MQVPFVKDAYRGELPINWFPAADDQKTAILFGTPGLIPAVILPSVTSIRGMHTLGNYVYVAGVIGNSTKVYSISTTGVVTLLGTILSNTGLFTIVNNGLQVCFCDGSSGYVYTLSTGVFVQITDGDFPGAGMFTYQDGYGIYNKPNTAQWGISALYDFTAYDGLDFAEKEGQADNLVGVHSDHRELWLFGSKSIEIWYNDGTSTPPFSRVSYGFIERGCAAAGSITSMDNAVYWLGDTRQVYRSSGYSPKLISNRKVEREISNFSTVDDAIAFVYADQGHIFYQLTFPTEDVTFVYDAATEFWHKRQSYNFGRHRANCYTYFNNMHYVGDWNSGIIYQMSMDFYKDYEDNIIRTLYSNEVSNEGKRVFFPGLQIHFDEGQGLATGEDPQAVLTWSDDGGYTYSNEAWASVSAGRVGEYGKRSMWRKLGSAFSRIFKLSVSDPVKWVVLSISWRK